MGREQCVLFGYIVFAIKSGPNKFSGQTGRPKELRNSYEILAEKLYGKRQLGNTCSVIRIILKSILQEVGVLRMG
jgi:hypothetical protein